MDLMDLLAGGLVTEAEALCARLAELPEPQRIEALNRIRLALHQVSPFKSEPIDCVLWVPTDQVRANEYNPNSVSPPEMRLLQRSIEADGYTQPVVTCDTGTEFPEQFTVVDGFHRFRVGKETSTIQKRIKGHLPVVVGRWEPGDLKERMAATIRHNRARGVHGVTPMVDVVAELIRQGWADSDICKELGMDPDEVLRFKQNAGLPELFKDHSYSRAWE